MAIISDAFPHRTRPIQYIRTYVTNLLYLGDMVPTIRGKLLRLVLCNLLSMDSEIKYDAKRSVGKKWDDETSSKLDELMSLVLDYM